MILSFFGSPVGAPVFAAWNGSGDEPPDLFFPVGGEDVMLTQEHDITPIRGRVVTLNTSALDIFSQKSPHPEGVKINLPLFSDAVFTAVINRQETTPTGAAILTGALDGFPDSEIILSLQNNVLSGGINLLDPSTKAITNYQINPLGAGDLYQVEQIEAKSLPVDLPAADPPQVKEGSLLTIPPVTAAESTKQVIDILVVYDDLAKSYLGGETATQARIAQIVGETNLGYTNSQINQEVNLVHASLVSYDETNFDWSTALNRLTSSSDGYMDEVHTLRDQYGADLVVFLVRNVQYCGLAWVLPPDPIYAGYGFSVVSAVCMSVGSYTFAHEMGHNMGSQHDRGNTSSSGAYAYSYGYQDPDKLFRTIMSYDCSGGCARINYWSNPNISYGGKPTGVDPASANSADNALSLNNTASIVASFRERSGPSAPSTLTVTGVSETQVSLSWSDNSDNETGFKLYRADGAGDFVLIDTLPADTTSAADQTVLCGAAYSYKITSANTVGDSVDSNTAATNTSACTIPTAPANVAAQIHSLNQVSLSWDDTANEAYYLVERRTGESGTWTQVSGQIPANTLTFLDNTVENKATYYYRVYAVNAAGSSLPSEAVQISVDMYPIYLPLTVNGN